MAITSLNRFSVPTDGSVVNQALLMPKMKYRFRVVFTGFGVTSGDAIELTKQVVDVTRPSVTFEEVTLDVYNSKVYLAGKHSFEAITINLRDDATGLVQRVVGEQLQKQFDFMEQASARSGIDYKFTCRIDVLDGGNGTKEVNTLESINLWGCFLTNVNYGELNYGTGAEPATVALSIRFDNMTQLKGGSTSVIEGIGRDIGERTLGSMTTGGGAV
jgi:hypothetical protein